MLDIYTAIAIAAALLAITFAFVAYIVRHDEKEEPKECPHCFADYPSRGIRKCIDCGLEIKINKTFYPKHQR
jgi:hypothetical protein